MELVLSICLISAPATCREEYLAVSAEPIAPIMCMTTAQPIIAEWCGTHPKWRVTRWRCEAPGRREFKI